MAPVVTDAPPAVDLTDMLAKAKARGLMGFAVVEHPTDSPDRYLALCMDRSGRPADPRNFHAQTSPQAALADLARRLA